MHLHEFLAHVHDIARPITYLEVGVQHGTSLNLAHAADVAIGIDPQPLIQATGNQSIYPMTSDDYFLGDIWPPTSMHRPIDFGFIDGLHHYEQALADFLHIETYCHAKSVVVFDDVLPRHQGEANRDMCPGDWTGDVWKVTHILMRYRPELRIFEVDTQPTGTLLVYGFEFAPSMSRGRLWEAAKEYMALEAPDNVLQRSYALDPVVALNQLKEYLA